MLARVLATVLIAAALLATASRAQEMPEVARSLMEDADRAREANHIDDAIAKYKRVIEVAPSLASAYVNLGALYFQQGKVAEAYDVFARGIAGAPADRTLLMNAAAAAQQLGKSAEALKYADAALEKNPRDAALHALRSTILRTLNRNDEALEAITQATQLAPDDAKYQFSRGNLLVALSRRDDAIAAFRKALDLDRNFLRAYYNLGAVLFEGGRYNEALDAYRMALAPIDQAFAKHQPVEAIHARAYANLGAIYLKQSNWNEAIDAYQKSAGLENTTAAHYNLGFLFFTTGRPDRAQDEYKKALVSDASLPLAYLHLGTIAFRSAKYDEAIKWLHDGMPHFYADSKRAAFRLLGRAQLARGDRTGARESLEEALKLDANDGESLLLLGRMARHDKRLDDAKPLLDRAQTAAPTNAVVMLERALVARDANDLPAERAAIEALLAREPNREVLRNELAIVNACQNPSASTIRALHITSAEVTAVLDALDGKREAAARTLAQSASPVARGDAGILLWQLGRNSDAVPHLAAAHKAFADWNEVSLAVGEAALADKRYDDAAETLSAIRCDAPSTWGQSRGQTLELVLGTPADVCARVRQSLTIALLSQSAGDLDQAAKRQDEAAARRARQIAERINATDDRQRSIALFLRGTADLVAGSDAPARDALTRAIAGDLPAPIAAMAKKNLEAAQPVEESRLPVEAFAPQQRLTVVVFLPDSPAENEKKLAEGATAIVNSLAAASSLPLKTELFRRADDARAFINANSESVGVVIANPEILPSGFASRYGFSHDGRTTYRRVVVVPARSSAKSLADLHGKTISAADALGDDGVAVTNRVADDLTALANALYGRTDAALVSESNPLLAEHTKDLRIVHTTSPQPMPVAAFGPMPSAERTALDEAFRSLSRSTLASLQMTSAVRIGAEPRIAVRREIQSPPVSALGLKIEPPIALPLRVSVEIPRVEISEDLFGPP
jgi:tetratricopeptide (TPR) repeat protein